MLMNLHKKSWTYGLKLQRFEDHHKANEKTIEVSFFSFFGGGDNMYAKGPPTRFLLPHPTTHPPPHPPPPPQAMLKLSKDYNERVQEEEGKTVEELIVANVGKIDPKRHLESDVAALMASNIVQCLGAMLDTIVF